VAGTGCAGGWASGQLCAQDRVSGVGWLMLLTERGPREAGRPASNSESIHTGHGPAAGVEKQK